MALRDELKDKIKSFARDNLGIKSWKEQVDENFDNGTEVALMKGFTRAAQNQFIKDFAKYAVEQAKPKKVIGGKKVSEYVISHPNYGYSNKNGHGSLSTEYYNRLMNDYKNGLTPILGRNEKFVPEDWEPYDWDEYVKPSEFKKYVKSGYLTGEDDPKVTRIVYSSGPNTLTPKKSAEEAQQALEDAIMRMPEDEQDAYLYGQRNLEDLDAWREKGNMNIIRTGAPYYNPGQNIGMTLDDHLIKVTPGADIPAFVSDVIHEGGHRSMAGTRGTEEHSVRNNLARLARQDIINEISNSDNPRQMINDLSQGNDQIKMWLSDAVGLDKNKRTKDLEWGHRGGYRQDQEDYYRSHPKKISNGMPTSESKYEDSAMSLESAAEIFDILGTPNGYAWMEKNAPATLRRFNRINKANKLRAERALGPDGAVPDKYNVNFHPELGD